MVCGRHHQPVPQRDRPPPEGPCQPAGAGGHLHRNQYRAQLQLCRAARRGAAHGRQPDCAGRQKGRPRPDLHAHDRRGGLCHAGLRAHWRPALGGVWRLCLRLAGLAHRRRRAGGHCQCRRGLARRQGRALQAAARRGHSPVAPQTCRRAAGGSGPGSHGPGGRARPPLGQLARAAPERHRALRVGGIHAPQLHALHQRHHRQAQGRAARHRWLHRGVGGQHEAHL